MAIREKNKGKYRSREPKSDSNIEEPIPKDFKLDNFDGVPVNVGFYVGPGYVSPTSFANGNIGISNDNPENIKFKKKTKSKSYIMPKLKTSHNSMHIFQKYPRKESIPIINRSDVEQKELDKINADEIYKDKVDTKELLTNTENQSQVCPELDGNKLYESQNIPRLIIRQRTPRVIIRKNIHRDLNVISPDTFIRRRARSMSNIFDSDESVYVI